MNAKLTVIVTLLLIATGIAQAKIPEPDSVIYGTLTIGDTIVTKADTSIIVTLKVNNETLSTYRMGDNIAAGNYYVLTIPIDIYGEQSPGTARPGDTAEIFVGDNLAETVTIGERGKITHLPVSLAAMACGSVQSGALLDSATYSQGASCGLSYQDYTINSGHTVTWDGTGAPLTGTIIIEAGGTLHITGPEAKAGVILLKGGFLHTDFDLTVTQLETHTSSSIDIGFTRTLTVTNELVIPAEQTLTLVNTGTLKVPGAFNLSGELAAGAAIVDLKGANLVLNNNLNLSGATLLTDHTTNLSLGRSITLTTDQPVHLGTLSLNNYALSLGSSHTDLTIYNDITLDHANEKIITGDADITFKGTLYLINGSITSTGGTVAIEGGGEMTGGILDVTGSDLTIEGGFVQTGGTIVTDAVSQATPLAHAGPTQTVIAGSEVTLDGSGSSDTDGTITHWLWEQIEGTQVTLSDETVARPTFTAPMIAGSSETLVFKLTVEDNDGLSDYATVTIHVTTADTYSLTIVKTGTGDGTIASDPNGLSCGSACSSMTRVFSKNTPISLSFAADSESVFTGWSIPSCAKRETCELVLDDHKTITAGFTKPTLLTQQQVNTGLISSGSGPYRVKDDLFVIPGNRLTIQAGSVLYVDRDVKLDISGRLNVVGTADNRVVMKASDPNNKWKGLLFTPSHDGSSTLRSVDISDAYSAIHLDCCGPATYSMQLVDAGFRDNQAAIKGFASYRVSVRNSTFENNMSGLFGTRRVDVTNSTFTGNQIAVLAEQGSIRFSTFSGNTLAVQNSLEGVSLTNNHIANNQVGIEIIDPSRGAIPGANFVIANNNILNNTQFNLKNMQARNLNLPENWWGSTNLFTIMSLVFDDADDATLGFMDPNVFLSAAVDTSPSGLSGLRGDIDGDALVTAGDATLYGQCITHRQKVAAGETEAVVDHDLGIVYQTNCTRLNDLNGDSEHTADDTTRLDQCVKHRIFTDLGLTEAAVDTGLGITFANDCQTVYNTF